MTKFKHPLLDLFNEFDEVTEKLTEISNINALLTEILADHSNGYTYFEYHINYGVWSGEFVLQNQVLLIHLEDETHIMIATTDIVNFTNGNIIDVESWVNTNLYYNTTEKEA